jgi:hypothetical protein
VLFESFGIDLDDHIIAESDLNGCSNTGFADQRVSLSVLLPVKQEEFQPFSPDSQPVPLPRQFYG